ncbi:MAG: hypothetical protein PF513_04225 [Tenericutes bacterium]|jgi:hypothetical protein|nr:hypothetical protein [Mycoplasmatota bacterium]
MEKFTKYLKEKGVKLVEKTNEVIDTTKSKIKDTILKDKLKRRFQLENPHKFVITESKVEANLLHELTATHAKIYEEDLVFVLFGHHKDNQVDVGYFVRDLKTTDLYIVKDIVNVEIPVLLDDEIYDVEGTAIYCEEL